MKIKNVLFLLFLSFLVLFYPLNVAHSELIYFENYGENQETEMFVLNETKILDLYSIPIDNLGTIELEIIPPEGLEIVEVMEIKGYSISQDIENPNLISITKVDQENELERENVLKVKFKAVYCGVKNELRIKEVGNVSGEKKDIQYSIICPGDYIKSEKIEVRKLDEINNSFAEDKDSIIINSILATIFIFTSIFAYLFYLRSNNKITKSVYFILFVSILTLVLGLVINNSNFYTNLAQKFWYFDSVSFGETGYFHWVSEIPVNGQINVYRKENPNNPEVIFDQKSSDGSEKYNIHSFEFDRNNLDYYEIIIDGSKLKYGNLINPLGMLRFDLFTNSLMDSVKYLYSGEQDFSRIQEQEIIDITPRDYSVISGSVSVNSNKIEEGLIEISEVKDKFTSQIDVSPIVNGKYEIKVLNSPELLKFVNIQGRINEENIIYYGYLGVNNEDNKININIIED